ncbi:MAG: hypothetical protein WC479_05950 [Candidatus Izemoplasmatales bacterium]|jgi:hypothetical protein
MSEQYLIEAITRIANSPELVKKLEGHVAFPMKVENWQTRRVLEATILLYDEWQKEKKKK